MWDLADSGTADLVDLALDGDLLGTGDQTV